VCQVTWLGVPKSGIKPFHQPRLNRAAYGQLSVSPEAGLVSNSQQGNSPPRLRPRYKVSDARSSLTRPTPASDAAPPLARSRPPVTSPTFLRRPTRQARRRQGSNHDIVTHNHIVKSCWSLCYLYYHYTHDPGLRGAALGHYSLEWGEIMPRFTPLRPRLSMLVKPQGQARRHRDDHDSTCHRSIVHRATYVRARRYNIKGQRLLLQQWNATNYKTRLETLVFSS
jgi:hypothetical protein